jgi:hypothetical protein
MSFINSLLWWQWIVLGMIPPAIIALYFLKLKRQPLEVPSTYLWSRTIEDLHVNSIWQRLRQSLLLLLQLLFVLLLLFACCRPGWRGTRLIGDRFIFLVDTSASMSATDVEPNRLEVAKRQILGMIDEMGSDDVAMLISFSDVARIEQSFTSSRSALRQKVQAIRATNRTTDLDEALRAAAGLANPGRTSDADNVLDVQVADALPATLYLFSDGGFAAVADFSLGNLTPKYIPIGSPDPQNVAIVALSAERNPERPDQMQAFARLENSGSRDIHGTASLHLNDSLIDAANVRVPAGEAAGVEFTLGQQDRGLLRLDWEEPDDLSLDNTAYAPLNPAREARVLLVTPGNDALQIALATDEVLATASVAVADPAVLQTKEHQNLAAAGYYDLIIYDQCQPDQMPQASTLFVGQLPPVEGWSRGGKEPSPFLIDTDTVHPLMQYIAMGDVAILEGFAVTHPLGGTRLMESDIGTLYAVAPREGFEDAVLGFEILGQDGEGRAEAKTDWPIRRSFPVFVFNAVRYLSGMSAATAAATVNPGQPILLRSRSPVQQVTVVAPDGTRTRIDREGQSTFSFSNTDRLGIYQVLEGGEATPAQQFAVNLFDSRESDLAVRDTIELGYEQVAGQTGLEQARIEAWRWLLILGLVILIFEWYVYNRRVYL